MRKEASETHSYSNTQWDTASAGKRAYERYDGEIVREAFATAEPHMTVMSFKVESEKPQPRDMPPSPQRIVAEPELESLLSNRWRFVATLPSGKIVVESLTPN